MLLYDLSLVNSTFNAIFSKKLYKVVRFTENDSEFVVSVSKRSQMLKNKHLRWLETLIVLVSPDPDAETEDDNSALCTFIANLVVKSKGLKSFA